jgi:hypothetical protein
MYSQMPLASDAAKIRAAAASRAFGSPIILNVWRGFVAETIVQAALAPEWEWCASDYNAWDFARADGLLLEVKQSAARQTWSQPGSAPSKAIFDIAPRTGRYTETAAWIEGHQRWADIYVFAHHDRHDDGLDHCDPSQWTFYVALAAALPRQKTIGLAKLRKFSERCDFAALAAMVETVARAAHCTPQASVSLPRANPHPPSELRLELLPPHAAVAPHI